jgi:hypothetical protein
VPLTLGWADRTFTPDDLADVEDGSELAMLKAAHVVLAVAATGRNVRHRFTWATVALHHRARRAES